MKTLLFIVFIFLFSQVHSNPCDPEQIHLSLSDAFTSEPTTNNFARVIFHTKQECKSAYISLTTAQGDQKITATAVNFFTYNYPAGVYSTYVHIFDFQDLEFSETYEYTCYGTDDGTLLPKQGPFEFYLPDPTFQGQETKVVMLGDADVSTEGITTINRLKQLAKGNFTKISAFLHYGDMAYNLVSKAGTVGDTYMKGIQDFAATMPYMVSAGNHENHYNYSNFNMRFQMPNFEQSQNHYYSFNLGNIHFTSFNLDLLLDSPKLKQAMLDWLDQDLQKANNNRDKQPWIVVFTHRPIYCSRPGDHDCQVNYKRFAEFEDLLNQYHVDLLVAGHVHVYDRMLPISQRQVAPFRHITGDDNYNYIINPQAPVHVLQGMAGHRGDYVEQSFLYKKKAFTVKVEKAYSFLAVSSKNSTHMLVENFRSDDGSLTDYFYIIKSQSVEYQEVPFTTLKYVEFDSSASIMGNSLFTILMIIFIALFI